MLCKFLLKSLGQVVKIPNIWSLHLDFLQGKGGLGGAGRGWCLHFGQVLSSSSVSEISQETAVNPVDIVSTLQALQMLKYWKGKHLVLKRQVKLLSASCSLLNVP